MTVVVLHNPRSGRGQAQRLAARFDAALRAAGYPVKSLAVGDPELLDPKKLANASALVLIGGDGTVNHAAHAAGTSRVPIYHVGTGNENLFARAFSMTRNPAHLVGALRRNRAVDIDAGVLSMPGHTPRRFLLMASVGPDASVIRRVAERRTRAIGHLAYTMPVIHELLTPYLPRLTIAVDGKPLVDDQQGFVVVSNIRHYAIGINPCPNASPHDAQLDVTFYPARSAARACAWASSAKLRHAHRAQASRTARGSHVAIATTDGPPILQLDGEHMGTTDIHAVELTVEPAALRVLMPTRGDRSSRTNAAHQAPSSRTPAPTP